MCEGLPQGFTGVAVALEFKRMGMPGKALGSFAAMLILPWAWKWLMGPFVDNLGFKRFGRRKQWILACQFGMLLTLLGALFLFPEAETDAEGVLTIVGLGLFSAVLLVHNIFAATQD